MKKLIFSFLILTLFYSCKKSIQENKNTNSKKKPALSILKKHASFNNLEDFSRVEINKWSEYISLQNFISRFENISPNEALSNSLELKNLVRNTKDSLRLEILKTPAFKTRLNVLENEVLRLADMTYIPSITAKEVNSQVAKILRVYESVNEKINTVFIKKQFEDNLLKDAVFIPSDSLVGANLKVQKEIFKSNKKSKVLELNKNTLK